MCAAQLLEDDGMKSCIRQFPTVHTEHASEDGAMWTS